MTEKTLPQIHAVDVVAQSRIFSIEQVQLQFGDTQVEYERIRPSMDSHGSVMIVPFIDQDTVCLVREYGVGLGRYTYAFPRGAVDAGESHAQAAMRELREETGWAAHELVHLTQMALSPSYLVMTMDVYVARDLYHAPAQGDEPEPLELRSLKLADVSSYLAEETPQDARTMAALLAVERQWRG